MKGVSAAFLVLSALLIQGCQASTGSPGPKMPDVCPQEKLPADITPPKLITRVEPDPRDAHGVVADPKPLDAQLYGERLDALLIDVVREANFVGRTRVTIQYDRGWKSGYVIVTDQGVGRHWEKPLSPAAIQRLVQIIDDRSLMAAGSSSRGACMDGTSWAVVIRLNWRVHEFFWDSCSSEEPSQALKEFFVAGGAE
jgi:hypothetical protein